MSKIPDNVLLIPGESGWEIWTGQPTAGYTLHRATEAELPTDIGDLPSGQLLMFFPVKAITAIPMRVTCDDDGLFSDLASLHAERLGMRPDPMAGQLTDTFVISREEDATSLLSIHLRAPGDEDLPKRGPKGFDISARAFPLHGNHLAIWKELGRWAFSLFHDGQLVYCQVTSSSKTAPDEGLTQEIRLALIQLSLQGMEVTPSRITVWTPQDSLDTSILSSSLGLPVEITARPAPIVPDPLSKLLPADVRAARKAAQQRQNITIGVAALALIYLGLIGWFSYSLWKDSAETRKLTAQAEAAAPEGIAYSSHIKKWDELSHAVDIQHSPVDILNRIARAIPPNSGLRLRVADISASEISLTGEAPQLQAVNTFSLNLNQSNDLANFQWSTPEPTQRERGWEFQYKASLHTN